MSSRHPTIGLELRYALMEASIASASANLPAALLEQLIKRGEWTPQQAFSHIERVVDERLRALALAAVAARLPDALLGRALSIACASQGEENCSLALQALVPCLPDYFPDDLWDLVVETVTGLTGATTLPKAAAVLVAHLPQSRLPQLWGTAPLEIRGDQRRLYITAPVALRMWDSPEQGIADALARIRRINNEFDRCQVLAAVVPYLPGETFDEVIAIMDTCASAYRGDALITLGGQAPTERLNDLFEFARSAIADSDSTDWCPRMMEAVRPRLPPEQVPPAALLLVQDISATKVGAETLEALAPALSPALVQQILDQIRDWTSPWMFRGNAEMIAVGALVACLPDDEASRIVNDYLRTFRNRLDVYKDDAELAPFARYLPVDALRRSLFSICHSMGVSAAFAEDLTPSLRRLALRLADDDDLMREAFEMVARPNSWRPESRMAVVSVLAPYLSNELLHEARDRVLPAPLEVECFEALASLSRYLPRKEQSDVVRRALTQVRQVNHERHQARAIAALAPVLPPDLIPDAFDIVQSVSSDHLISREEALDVLAPKLPKELLWETTNAVLSRHAGTLTDVTKHMPQLFTLLGQEDTAGPVRDFLDQCKAMAGEWERGGDDLSALAPFLSPSLAQHALGVARRLPWVPAQRVFDRWRAMAALAPRLPEELRKAVVHEVLDLQAATRAGTEQRAHVLAPLAEASCTDEVVRACHDLLTELQHIKWTNVRCEALIALARPLPKDLLPDALRCAEQSQPVSDRDRLDRSKALVALGQRMPPQERDRVLSEVLDQILARRWWSLWAEVHIELIRLLPLQRSQVVEAAITDATGSMSGSGDLHNINKLLRVLNGSELELIYQKLDGVRNPNLRAKAMAAVLRRAGELAGKATLFSALPLHRGWPVRISRAELFELVAASAWWIRQHGGTPAIVETVKAVFDVARWWP
jgi:uncharacterized protein (DUF2267 family)